MSDIEKAHGENGFPADEVFTDFTGRKRRFLLMQYPTPLGHAVRASEDVDGEGNKLMEPRWSQEGATLGDRSARKEYGLTQRKDQLK